MNLVAYLRCSTEMQEDSTDTQERLIRDWAASHNHTITHIYDEGALSSSTLIDDRPAASELFAAIQHKKRDFEGVVVLRKDRLFRNLYEEIGAMRVLEKYKCSLYTPDGVIDRSTPEAEFMSNIMGAAAEFERKITGKRIREHNMSLAMQGKLPCGNPPLGYAYDKMSKTVVLSDRAQDAVRIYQLYAEYAGNSNEVARRLHLEGIKSKNGTPMQITAVMRVLQSSYYRQSIYYAGRTTYSPETIPELIPKQLLAAVDNLLARLKTGGTRSRGMESGYASFLQCGICGANMCMNHKKYKQHERQRVSIYRGWRCPNHNIRLCQGRQISEYELDMMIEKALKMLFAGILEKNKNVAIAAPNQEENRAEKITQTLNAQRQRWAQMFAEEIIDWNVLNTKIADIDNQLEALKSKEAPIRLDGPTIVRWASSMSDNWAEVPPVLRRELFGRLDARIVVTNEPENRPKLDFYTNFADPITIIGDKYRRRKDHRGLT